MSLALSGVVVRCYAEGCGWVGDSGEACHTLDGERCPTCGGSTVPPLRFAVPTPPPTYRVLWDNGHACGALPGEHTTKEAAKEAGEDWRAAMIFADDEPEESAEVYSYEVEEVPS